MLWKVHYQQFSRIYCLNQIPLAHLGIPFEEKLETLIESCLISLKLVLPFEQAYHAQSPNLYILKYYSAVAHSKYWIRIIVRGSKLQQSRVNWFSQNDCWIICSYMSSFQKVKFSLIG